MPTTNPFAALPKMFVQIAIASGAIYCGISRVSDYKHHPGDVVAGLLLGSVIGVLVFFGVLVRACIPLLKLKNVFPSDSDVSKSGNQQVLGMSTTDSEIYNIPTPNEVDEL